MKIKNLKFMQGVLMHILIISVCCMNSFASEAPIIKTDKDTYDSSETIKIYFSNATGKESDWICVSPIGSPDKQIGDYKSMPLGEEKGVLTFDSLPPGKYEARAFFNFRKTGYSATARYPFSVVGTDIRKILKECNLINVGWIDLGEEKYKNYGYAEKDKEEWIDLIKAQNLESFPKFLKEFFPKKTILTAKLPSEVPQSKGVVITFTDANYFQETNSVAQVIGGFFAGSDTLKITINITDGESKKLLYSGVKSIGSSAGSMSNWSFNGRVSNTFYNLAYFIWELSSAE